MGARVTAEGSRIAQKPKRRIPELGVSFCRLAKKDLGSQNKNCIGASVLSGFRPLFT